MAKRIKLTYGGILPKPGEMVSGGKVKLLHLGEVYPESNSDSNILYLVSSALPKNVLEIVKKAKKKGVKIVWNQNGVGYPAWAGKNYDSKNVLMREIIHQADWVIFQSHFCKESGDKYLGVYKGPSSIIYNCANTATFKQRKKSLPSEPIQLLVMGSHHQHQRVTLALETTACLRKRNIPVKLNISGRLKWGSGAKDEVMKQIEALDLKDHVTLLGPYLQKDAPSRYHSSHILLHFKYNDPCPTVPIESMCCGIPVVSSDSGGMLELLKNKGGITLPVPKNWEEAYYPSAEASADAILDIMKDYQAWSKKANKHANTRFGKEKWLNEHTRIFSGLLNV